MIDHGRAGSPRIARHDGIEDRLVDLEQFSKIFNVQHFPEANFIASRDKAVDHLLNQWIACSARNNEMKVAVEIEARRFGGWQRRQRFERALQRCYFGWRCAKGGKFHRFGFDPFPRIPNLQQVFSIGHKTATALLSGIWNPRGAQITASARATFYKALNLQRAERLPENGTADLPLTFKRAFAGKSLVEREFT